ncbi:MAG: rhomboid family intramembrane serine protease [Gemmatimonadales bacterium]|jgi:membrane associated rhomboid family serine protease
MRTTPFALTPWVRGLIAANAAVYLLQLTLFTGPWFGETFAFDPSGVGRQWWGFATYMFVHVGFLHLALNVLMLFIFGPAVEERLGGTAFAAYYALCGVGGAVASLALSLVLPLAPLVGASAAVFGVALAFAVHWPDHPIYVFPIPFPIKAKWLALVLATLALVAAMRGSADGVAHFAHVGGLLAGFLYLRSEESVRQRARKAFQPRVPAHVVPRTHRREPVQEEEPQAAVAPAPTEPAPEQDEVDRLLDKISESGLDSLTPDERRLLDDVSRQLRDE